MVSVSAILVYRHETSVRGVLGDEQPEEAYLGDYYYSLLPLLSEGIFAEWHGGGTCEDPKMAKNEDTDVWKFPCSAPRERSRSL